MGRGRGPSEIRIHGGGLAKRVEVVALGQTSKGTANGLPGGAVPAGGAASSWTGGAQSGADRRSGPTPGYPEPSCGPDCSFATPRQARLLGRRDSWAGEHEGKRRRRNTVELSPGSTSWGHGDLRPLLRHGSDRGLIRPDGSTTCAPDGMVVKDRPCGATFPAFPPRGASPFDFTILYSRHILASRRRSMLEPRRPPRGGCDTHARR